MILPAKTLTPWLILDKAIWHPAQIHEVTCLNEIVALVVTSMIAMRKSDDHLTLELGDGVNLDSAPANKRWREKGLFVDEVSWTFSLLSREYGIAQVLKFWGEGRRNAVPAEVKIEKNNFNSPCRGRK